MNDKSQRREDKLDESLEETFPARDAPSNTVETGIGVDGVAGNEPVRDNREESRFELVKDGELAFLQYERGADALSFVHTEVPPSLRGQHVGEALVDAGLKAAHAQGLRIKAVCPFVRAYLRKHPHTDEIGK